MEKRLADSSGKYRYLLIITLVGVLFLTGLWNLGKFTQFSVIDDEFGYLGTAAFLAGRDWRALISTSPYYGFGISLIYFFLYLIFNNSVMVYRSAIVLNVVFVSLSFLLSLKVADLLFRIKGTKNEWVWILICFFICLYPNTVVQIQYAWTESVLYFWFWMLTYLLVSAVQTSGKQQLLFISVFAFLLPVGLWIHQRTLGVCAVGAVILLLYFFKEKKARSILLPLFLFLAGTGIYLIVKKQLTVSFWNYNTELQTLFSKHPAQLATNTNDFSGQTSKLLYIFSLDGIVDLFRSCVGKAFYLFYGSAFLIPISFISFHHFFLKYLRRRKVREFFLDFGQNSIILFLIFSLLASFLISAVFMIYGGLRADFLLYGRYSDFVVGPFLLFGLAYLYRGQMTNSNMVWLMLIGLLLAKLTSGYLENGEYVTVHTTNIVSLAYQFSSMGRAALSPYDIAVKYSIVVMIGYMVCNVVRSSRSEKIYKYSLLVFIAYLAGIYLILFKPNIDFENRNRIALQEQFSYQMEETADYLKDTNKEIVYLIDDTDSESIQNSIGSRSIKYLQYWLDKKPVQFFYLSDIDEFDKSRQILIVPEDAKFDLDRLSLKPFYSNDVFSVY